MLNLRKIVHADRGEYKEKESKSRRGKGGERNKRELEVKAAFALVL